MAKDVRDFIEGQLSNPHIKKNAQIPGTILYRIINKLEQKPFFYYNGNKQSRFVFSSWYGVLDLRLNTYTDPYERDLYLIHELNHMATIDYKQMTDQEWIESHIRNEKASSFWSEVLIYFAIPEIYSASKQKFELWVTPYYEDKKILVPGVSNHQLFASAPSVAAALLFQEFANISEKDFYSLTSADRRTRVYDYKTEAWCDANACLQTFVNQHMAVYSFLLKNSQVQSAIELHEKFLVENTSARGKLFDVNHPLFAGVDQMAINKAAMADTRAQRLELKYKIPCKLTLQGYLSKIIETTNEHEKSGKITTTPLVAPTKQLLEHAGVTNTIYALFTQQARQEYAMLQNDSMLQDKLYGMAASRKQDGINNDFADQYKSWTNGLVLGLDDFKYFYPAAGSSEALRETIVALAANAKNEGNSQLKLHVFQAEYEGAKSYAAGNALRVVEYPNRDLQKLASSTEIKAGDLFYLSYPSSLDGNCWDQLEEFLDIMHKKGVKVLLDLTYIGCYVDKTKIPANHPSVECVYVSLSKSFGVYYQRVGGVFTKNPNLLLFGNQWFKNMFSLRLGMSLMQAYDRKQIPEFYKPIQNALISLVNGKLGLKLEPSDVFLIATQYISRLEYEQLSPEKRILCRPQNNGENYILRVCLQPMLDYLTNDFASKTFPVLGYDLKSKHVNENSFKTAYQLKARL